MIEYDLDSRHVESIESAEDASKLTLTITLKDRPNSQYVYADTNWGTCKWFWTCDVHTLKVGFVPGIEVGSITNYRGGKWLFPRATISDRTITVVFMNKNSKPPRITGTIE